MSFYTELPNLELAALIERWNGPTPVGEDAYTYYSEIAFALEQQSRAGLDFLIAQLNRADLPRLQALLDVLPSPNHPLPLGVLLGYLQPDQSAGTVAKAIDGLRLQNERSVLARIEALVTAPAPEVRSSVLRYLSRLYPERAYPFLIEALHDSAYLVRENSADELDSLGAVSAVPELRPLLADPVGSVRQAAQTALENLGDLVKNS